MFARCMAGRGFAVTDVEIHLAENETMLTFSLEGERAHPVGFEAARDRCWNEMHAKFVPETTLGPPPP